MSKYLTEDVREEMFSSIQSMGTTASYGRESRVSGIAETHKLSGGACYQEERGQEAEKVSKGPSRVI